MFSSVSPKDIGFWEIGDPLGCPSDVVCPFTVFFPLFLLRFGRTAGHQRFSALRQKFIRLIIQKLQQIGLGVAFGHAV
jgi:hypothetical protein